MLKAMVLRCPRGCLSATYQASLDLIFTPVLSVDW